MKNEVFVTNDGNLQLPLPFKKDSLLPDNKFAVYSRSVNTLERLKRNSDKLDKCTKVMEKYIADGHVRQIPFNELKVDKGKAWWLPVFPVTHPKKSKVRIVFDSSASFSGTSLNNELMQGPDNNNLLLGVLLRFRIGEIGFCGDIEHMFHCFYVEPEHRNFLRFYWYYNNDPSINKIVEFQALVHVFGNTSSPAVANFGLRYAADNSPCECPNSSREFIKQSMYVDDGIASAPSAEHAVDILKGAKELLSHYNIRLHKIVSNSEHVIKSFPSSECAEEVKLLTSKDTISSTLGLSWKTNSDELVLKSNFSQKPFTKRGILSINSSNYDPLGITAPVTLGGRIFQRMILPPKGTKDNVWNQFDWDDPLPDQYLPQWNKWVESLHDVSKVSLLRCYTPARFGEVKKRTLHVYCDASKDAICYVSYLQSESINGSINVSFVMANSKVSPRLATSIPRLELCAGVEAVVASKKIVQELHDLPDQVKFYTDSKILLGYLHNQEKRFTRYVTRRVELILSTSSCDQWSYVATDKNPADIGTHPHTPNELLTTCWLSGPKELWGSEELTEEPLLPCLTLPEVVDKKEVLVTKLKETSSLSREICSRTRDLTKALRVFGLAMKFLNLLDVARQKQGILLAPRSPKPRRAQVIQAMLLNAQNEVFCDEKKILANGENLPLKDPLSMLNPFEDNENILRVGGRLSRAALPYHIKHPVVLPRCHPVSEVILHHFHHRTMHAGRHITHGALREAGYYLLGSLRKIKKMISECCLCRALRAPTQTQKMSDLPTYRLEETPPFSNVGLDVFGPYLVHDGHTTRRSKGTKKLWGLLFTCLYSRAVHVEPLQGMDISSFRNALRRFWSIRGTCKLMVSDQGTNFLGAKNQMESAVDEAQLQRYAESQDVQWDFITPGASHQGGAWERKVGAVKSVLNATLRLLHNQTLSRDELSTLFYEASAVVNNTPMWEVSTNLENPFPLTPSMLLTLKEDGHPPAVGDFCTKDLLSYGRARWRRVQYLADQFWCRWKSHYVTSLQLRHKWKGTNKCVSIGDVVLLKQNSKRNSWPLAIIVDVKKSRDNLVRSVTLKLFPKESNGKPSFLERSLHDTILIIPSNDHKC